MPETVSFNREPAGKVSSWFRRMKNAKPRMQNAKLKNKEFRCNPKWEEILFEDDKVVEN
jgi:hypothetical protein